MQVPAALLLKDKQGDKISPLMGGVVHRTSITNVLRGSLLTPLPRDKQVPRQDGDFPHNYQTMYEEKTVTVFSEEDDVAPLSGYEHLLMACIQSLEARYQTFVATNKLDWGVQLKCGDHVYVSIPGQHAAETMATQRAAAVIRYVGGVKPLNGLTFGVEIVVMNQWSLLCICCVPNHTYMYTVYDISLSLSTGPALLWTGDN